MALGAQIKKDELSYTDRRRAAIEDAAYAVLAEKGYKAASMLEIAKRAGASNETLYKWYGNKQGLFRSLIEGNAAQVTGMIDASLAQSGAQPALDVLQPIGEALLKVLTSDRAIAINRAAAGDVHDTGTLGAALAEGGRGTVLPRVAEVLGRVTGHGEPMQLAETWLALLVGDLQVRLVTGQAEAPAASDIKRRAQGAVSAIRTIYLSTA
ncbi:MAG: TetR/AcrR family transcriptional regulator [Pseudomonadota bacterium]